MSSPSAISPASTSPPRFYPPDVLEAVAAAVYDSALPCTSTSLDPLYSYAGETNIPPPSDAPSTYPPPYWSEPTARKTLSALCLVSKDFRSVARPWLWRRLEVNIPRNWLGILDTVCGDEEEAENAPNNISAIITENEPEDTRSRAVTKALPSLPDSIAEVLSSSSSAMSSSSESSSDDHGAGPSGWGSVPHDLLTPPASRDPSPARLRLRAASPGRWRFIKAVNKIVHHADPGLYVPTPDDPSPGRHVRHLDFNHFRTIGLRRSVGDGIHARFVTEARLERLLKEMPNLKAFGATEFMDSAISTGVLAELILRGSPVPPEKRAQRPARRGRGAQFRGASSDAEDEDVDGDEFDEAERRAAAKPLEALDFCGCVSTVFVAALHAFVHNEGLVSTNVTSNPSVQPRTFTGLRRLGLRGVTSVPASVLSALVLSFPNLTHLDLTGTLCTPALLDSISERAQTAPGGEGMRLKSLALGRCIRLNSDAIARFIIGPSYNAMVDPASPPSSATGGVCDDLEELSLYGDSQFPTQLTEEDLIRIVSAAPCFTSTPGKLRYLDLSSCPVTPRVLERAFGATPSSGAIPESSAASLRSLGLSYIPNLSVSPLICFLLSRAPNVEILTLLGSCTTELSLAAFGGTGRVGEVALALTVRSKLLDPLCSLPFRIQGLHTTGKDEVEETPTRLRVLEFSPAVLNLLPPSSAPCVGATTQPSWTTVRSRGGRAWYVDASACWINGKFTRGTSAQGAADVRPVLNELTKLAAFGAGAAGGHGSVGWHAHKMEVLHGLGMLGREDGLYGAVSFAYTTG